MQLTVLHFHVRLHFEFPALLLGPHVDLARCLRAQSESQSHAMHSLFGVPVDPYTEGVKDMQDCQEKPRKLRSHGLQNQELAQALPSTARRSGLRNTCNVRILGLTVLFRESSELHDDK